MSSFDQYWCICTDDIIKAEMNFEFLPFVITFTYFLRTHFHHSVTQKLRLLQLHTESAVPAELSDTSVPLDWKFHSQYPLLILQGAGKSCQCRSSPPSIPSATVAPCSAQPRSLMYYAYIRSYVSKKVSKYVCMYACMYVCMCMHVYIYIYIYIYIYMENKQ